MSKGTEARVTEVFKNAVENAQVIEKEMCRLERIELRVRVDLSKAISVVEGLLKARSFSSVSSEASIVINRIVEDDWKKKANVLAEYLGEEKPYKS